MTRPHSAMRLGAPRSLLLVGAFLLVTALILRPGGSGAPGKASTAGAGPSSPVGTSGPGPSRVAMASGRPLPSGLDDRGWIAEVGVQRWLAGTLSGRAVTLPTDEIALAASATIVVSVRYGPAGRTSTVRVRDLAGGRLRMSVDRPGTVSSAVIVEATIYVAGDSGTGGGSDPGVQAISLADGSVRDVIPPGPAPATAAGPVTRTQLHVDPSGTLLGSSLCSGDQCAVDLVDLVSGGRTTPVGNAHGFLVALTNHVLYLVNDTSTALDALDVATGAPLWRLDDVQVGGVQPTSDGARVVLSYLSTAPDGSLTFTLASADARSGERTVVLTRPAAVDVPGFYPGFSGDKFAVIGSGGTLGEVLASRGEARLSLVDLQTGAVRTDVVTITAP